MKWQSLGVAKAETVHRRFDRFRAVKSTIESARDSNEATTRLRAIDTLLFDVLEWDKATVETELYCRAGYSDYALTLGGTVAVIVEAKRDKITFALGGRSYPSKAVGFSLLEHECPEAGEAIRQAASYANELGARYVAISNGKQWILALTHVSGQSLEFRSVIVFESLDAIENRFDAFHAAFSAEDFAANSPSEVLLEPRVAPAPRKLSSRITGYPVLAARNPVANEISVIAKMVWNEVGAKELSGEFLRACYVTPPSSGDALSVAVEYLEQRPLRDLGHTEGSPADRATSLIKGEMIEKPVIVLGRIGHGKSTFLRYLRTVHAERVLENYIQIEIDFLDRPDTRSDVPDFVYRSVIEQLRVRYGVDVEEDRTVRGVLRSELTRFRKSPRGVAFGTDTHEFRVAEIDFIESVTRDRHTYLRHVIHHIKAGRQKSVALFMDNLDRRSQEIQDEAFLKASAIARDWESLVFVCLRPDTYHKSRLKGVLDSIVPRTILVEAPDPAIMLKKRFEYAIAMASGGGTDGKPLCDLGSRNEQIQLNLPTAAKLLECCRESFWRNRNLVSLFNAVANGSSRVILDSVREFLTSDHFNTRKIIERLERGQEYVIPVHEAQRALLFGDYLHYDPRQSRFVNLFDVLHSDPREHFSALLVLRYLEQAHSKSHGGLVAKQDVIQYLGTLGFTSGVCEWTFMRLLDGKCIEGVVPESEDSATLARIRITSNGRYLINELVHLFVYVDAVLVDTPIVLPDFSKDIYECREIQSRIERASVFVRYLRLCAEELSDSRARAVWADHERFMLESIAGVQRNVDSRT